MVNPDVVAVAEQLQKRKVLVTGGSGFVGSHLAKTLAAAGHDVLAIGRNPYRYPFGKSGPAFERVDITNAAAVAAACADRTLIYHCAALASPWGPRETFDAVNVEGTRNVVNACEGLADSRLIHVSSTAVQFDFKDAENVSEDDAVASPFACEYARSKAMAEDVVREAASASLQAVIIRARAIFGPGDRSLQPRLLRAADTGRLKTIGDGSTALDLTYIDNLILALILAAEKGRVGGTYTITNDEPVQLSTFLQHTLQSMNRALVLKRVSRGLALKAAGWIEGWHRWRNKPGEPSTTKYAVGLLSTTKTFDISAAKRDLGYRPVVDMLQGHRRTTEHLNAKDDTQSDVHVGLKLFTTGYTEAKAHHAEKGAQGDTTFRFHAMIAVIDHPVFGLTLFDTGYSPRFFEATARFPHSLYAKMTPVETCAELSAVNVLAANGIDPNSIQRILLSHFHADHTCGLRDFADIDIVCSQRGYDNIRNAKGLAALKRAFVPDLMPSDLHQRFFGIDVFHDPGVGPFERTHDFFGDGSVRLVDLSGHAAGQLGVLVQRNEGDRVLLAADACWTSQTIVNDLRLTTPFRLLADNAKEAAATTRKLHEFHEQYPEIEIIPTHCPEVAQRYEFDAMVTERMAADEANHKVT